MKKQEFFLSEYAKGLGIEINEENPYVTAPKGFKACGDFVGIKKVKKDMALIESETYANAAGCFTTNVVKAAPVLWDMEKVSGKIKGIVANSGNANACTGEKGIKDAAETAEIFAKLIGAEKDNVLVCSTGVIGVNMPMDTVKKGIEDLYPKLDGTAEGGKDAALAIMTTDTMPKTISLKLSLGGKTVYIGGMAKGSGMINPNMATMLCFITTDAAIARPLLQEALSECIADTFNMISVDGDTSTNDTVIVLANGMAGNTEITDKSKDYEIFKAALFEITRKLAVDCANDGEGATKLIEANIKGAYDKNDARQIALSVVSSNLLKAAIFGEDANWGRALCAMGYSGAKFDPYKVSIYFRSKYGKIMLMDCGKPIVFDEDEAKKILSDQNIYIDIELCEGNGEATAWGCDLTYEYVKINGDYRS